MLRIFAYIGGWLRSVPADSVVAPIIGNFAFRRLRAAATVKIVESKTPIPIDFNTDDLVAIYLYTHQQLHTYHYKSLNQVLRGLGHRKRKELLILAAALETALRKLPPYEGFLSRETGFDQAELNKHRVGAIVTYPAFTSTSKKPKAPLTRAIALEIYGKSGRCIEGFSRFPAEEEVLFLPGTQFQVLHVTRRNGKINIVLEEM